MKIFLFLLALSLAWPALAQETAPAPDKAPFEWRLRFKTGQKFRVTTETTLENSQQMPAMPGTKTKLPAMQMTTKNRLVAEQTVVSSDQRGARIETVYRQVSDSSRMMQGDKVVYDSAQPPAGMEEMGDVSQKMVGAKFSYLLSPRGEISEIEGVEAYLKQTQGDEEKQSPALQTARAGVAEFFTPEAMKQAFGQLYDVMPPQTIAIGDTWTHTSTLPVMGTSFTTDTTNRFVSRKNGLISISQSGQFSSDAGAQLKIPLPANATKGGAAPVSQMDLQGTIKGELTIDEQSGLILRNFEAQDLAGEMIMSGLTGKGSVMTVPMQMKFETTVTTEEIKAGA